MGILSVWPTRILSVASLLADLMMDMLTLYRSAIPLRVSPRLMT